jgi:hypothetical protein
MRVGAWGFTVAIAAGTLQLLFKHHMGCKVGAVSISG